MSLLILKPTDSGAAYDEAASAFQRMYEQVTGKRPRITAEDDLKSDLILIGSDAVNDFLMNEMLEARVSGLGIRYGTDDYCIRSYQREERRILILAGGRGRSTLYAVYDYFERYADCHYFWDGDVIPHRDEIAMENIDVQESPRFEYRGLRYFAHRGLKRFQAEHWSFEDWKREIDWMIRKRLNFFMLRIGMDDVWQRAFPKTVPYPKDFQVLRGEATDGYNDRSDFWSLQYRGELRKKILAYARDMDLTYPVDCGTMTHWYSRTPDSFLKAKQPTFLPQQSNSYSYAGDRVWDFRIKEHMDDYMHLTETMVKEYDMHSDLFHTIGLGERRVFADKRKNFELKLLAYRRISDSLRQRYPDSKLMLASWDFYFCWSPQEVQGLIKELDPERTIILDYTSEGKSVDKNFTSWGIVGKFPWIFGMFHAYEPDSELRGNYKRTDEKLRIAADDPYCKGMVLWPELSHSDPLALEYLTSNAWSPLERSIEALTERFCHHRYGAWAEQMNGCWQKLLPLIRMSTWDTYQADRWCRLSAVMTGLCRQNTPRKANVEWSAELADDAVSAIERLAELGEGFENAFVLRDAVDLVRTVLGRCLNHVVAQAMSFMEDGGYVLMLAKHYQTLLDVLSRVLALNDDFSIYHSLKALESVAPVNPEFELTLKKNIYNNYCTQPAYELVCHLFPKEGRLVFDWMAHAAKGKTADFKEMMKPVIKQFMETPLAEMQPQSKPAAKVIFSDAAHAVKALLSELSIAK